MKITIKTSKGFSFEIEVEPSSTVLRRAAALFPLLLISRLRAESLLVAGAAS
jgi:hypothetical protein